MLDWDDPTGSDERFTERQIVKYMERIRAECTSSNVAYLVRYVVRGCAQLGLNFESDLGTTEGNLRDMERNGWKSHARFFISYLRNWPINLQIQANDILRHIENAAAQAECRLEDLGTSSTELAEYVRRGEFRNKASSLLSDMRNNRSQDLASLRSLLKEARCGLEHINPSSSGDTLTDEVHWKRFRPDPRRVELADEISFVYRLVEVELIDHARSEWARITANINTTKKLGGNITLSTPDTNAKEHGKIQRVKEALWALISHLHVSTNDTIRMHWQAVNDRLFLPKPTAGETW